MKIELTKPNRNHLFAIINTYGTGEHPIADDNSLQFFEVDYVKEVLAKAYSVNKDDERRSIIDGIREELGICV